ncbi:uncharacterized protein FOMMEDRAFT_16067 [Fomitiporia mediterranea MF3/22]|uniref:uncharacterized protein n=1 Tax=Fomitiporia mediterranea (strain MF3/22) TaxID=694068 RepID=UPI0004407993|nr:uncharacterized protein FOMMEDRAFT_16067 [Fomitiporia mediterranea MF3/22]EJD07379.1 hypothetical protein FOMMEDRAFT_16067 [Fomitiporia mediterranea MF3/22]
MLNYFFLRRYLRPPSKSSELRIYSTVYLSIQTYRMNLYEMSLDLKRLKTQDSRASPRFSNSRHYSTRV